MVIPLKLFAVIVPVAVNELVTILVKYENPEVLIPAIPIAVGLNSTH